MKNKYSTKQSLLGSLEVTNRLREKVVKKREEKKGRLFIGVLKVLLTGTKQTW